MEILGLELGCGLKRCDARRVHDAANRRPAFRRVRLELREQLPSRLYRGRVGVEVDEATPEGRVLLGQGPAEAPERRLLDRDRSFFPVDRLRAARDEPEPRRAAEPPSRELLDEGERGPT